jgi:succinate dehydrogenase hydrophobic anchor subunit
MKVFLEEYGLALFSMICVIFLIVIASPISKIVQTAMSNVVNSFSNKTTKSFSALTMPTIQ